MHVDDDNLPEFFKVYISQHSSKEMLIPSEFVDYMGEMKSGSAELVGSSGRTWQVELVEDGKDLYFTDGWRDFVEASMIQDGEFLFFKFHGSLIFSVVIYDESVCEKGAVFIEKCSQVRNGVVEAGEELNGVRPVKREDVGLSRPEGLPVIAEGQNAAAARIMPSSVKPSFVLNMKKYNVERNYIVNIPPRFVKENTLCYQANEKMILRTKKDSSWPVNITRSKNITNCSYFFCGGWAAFVRDNNIKEGDTCQFEILSRLEMKVHLTPNS